MAAFLSNVFRSVSLSNSHSLRYAKIIPVIFQRSIYGDSFLAIDEFLHHREKVAAQYVGSKDKFISRMNNFLENDNTSMVFTEDLKHLVHLAENKSEDIELMTKMLKRFTQQSNELRFGRYIFGPVVMRFLHHVKNPEVAYQLFKDESLAGFFDQVTSYTLLLDLLYKCEKYQQVLEIFEMIMQKNVTSRFPRDPMVLMLASCYKLNTPDSLMLTTKWLQEAKQTDAVILRKGVTFAAALALKQNQPSQALEILSLTVQSHYFTVKNLKIVALVQLDRIEDALRIMRNSIERDMPDTSKRTHEYCAETLSIVKEAIDASQNKEHSLIFQRIEKALREIDIVGTDVLDVAICAPILHRPIPREDSRTVGFESKFFAPGRERGERHFQQRQSYGARSRHGLADFDD